MNTTLHVSYFLQRILQDGGAGVEIARLASAHFARLFEANAAGTADAAADSAAHLERLLIKLVCGSSREYRAAMSAAALFDRMGVHLRYLGAEGSAAVTAHGIPQAVYLNGKS